MQIAVILSVLIIAAGIIYFVKFQHPGQNRITTEQLLQIIFSPAPSTSSQKSLETCSESALSLSVIPSSWEQYTSTDFQYSIYYPPEWKFSVKEGSTANFLTLSSPDFHENSDKVPDKGSLISVFAVRQEFASLDDLYSALVSRYTLLNRPVPFISACLLRVGNNQALRIEEEKRPSNILNFYFLRSNSIYYDVSLWQFNSDYINTFEQLLSTFKLSN